MRSRSLDYRPLTDSVGLRGRLRTVAGDNLLVIGMTVGVLLVAGALAVFLVQLISGQIGGFGWFCIGFLFPCGVWVMVSGLLQAGKGGSVAAFAQANDLELTRSTMATTYAGSLFADGSHLVRQSVRTPGETFVEVGDRWPATPPKVGMSGITGTVQAEPHTAQLFMRVRLNERVRPGTRASEIVTPALDEELRRFAGDYTVEVAGQELTVFGSRELEATRPDRMEQAIGLAERLAAHHAGLVGSEGEATTSGIPIPQLAEVRTPGGRPMGALKAIGLVLALVVVGALVIAVVMSVLDDGLRGQKGLAEVVVLIVIAVLLAAVAGLVRLITTPRRERTSRMSGSRRRTR